MNEDRRELIVRLCTVAGMLMEDTCASAIMMSGLNDAAMIATVDRLVSASGDIHAIVGAAAVLARPTAD